MIRFLIGALLTVFLLTAQVLTAQVITANNCVHRAGDHPDWASPNLDDSQWSKEFPVIGGPYVWTRCRLDVASMPRPIQVGVQARVAWELFVDGQPAGSFGDMRTGMAAASFQQRSVPATAGKGAAVIVALRQLPGRHISAAVTPTMVAGNKDSLKVWHSEEVAAGLRRTWPSWVGGAVTIVIGIVLLVLFFSSGDGNRKELLWFGLFSVCSGMIRFQENYLLQASSDYPNWLFLSIWGICNSVEIYVIPKTFFTMAGRRVPTFYSLLSKASIGIRVLRSGMALLAPIELAQRFAAWGGWSVPLTLLLFTSAAAAFWPPGKVQPSLRLARNLGLLFMVALMVRNVPQLPGLQRFGWYGNATNFQSSLVVVVSLGIFALIARQHRQVSLDRAELQGEMKAAQEVQRLLTSSTLDVAPWAEVDVAYVPAREVGGDFYFCRQTANGQLIVVGDVSGKGLRAAMLASVAIGALRNSPSCSPGPLLGNLNTALHGQTGGGFVTCCAALLRNDGQLIIANAGHPLPYVDGREFAVESGLPLGIVADSVYEESTGRGESVTLVSDGVVEAENGERELFGFERTREISRQSARMIADAAQAWGQNDDITVVTVAYA